MARALSKDEAEAFKNAISQERKIALEHGFVEGLLEFRDEEIELTPESGFWLGNHFPGATNS